MKLPRLATLALAFGGLLTLAPAQPAPRIPEGTKAFRDVSYVTNGHVRQKLDLYIPENAEAPTPIVVWIHGGGWAAGDKNGCPPLNSGYLKRGYAAVSLDYRLSGDAIFPAQIEDCKAAIRWLRAHAKEYNLDPNRIGVWGASAGGHLAALLGATGNTREFDVGENLDQSSAVQAVSDFYGPTDLVQMDAHAVPGATLIHDSPRSPESRLVGGPLQEKPFRDLAAKVNPIPYLTKNSPPHLIVHGDKDMSVPHHQSILLHAALEKLGVPVRFHTIKGAGHGSGFAGPEIREMVAAFFDYHLLGNKTSAADWPVTMTTDSVAVMEPERPGQNRPGAAAPSQAGPQGGGQRPTWSQILSRDDTNRDGKISRDEFKGPPPLFERIDRNADGVLTEQEFTPPGRPAGTPSQTAAPAASATPAGILAWRPATASAPDSTAVPLIWVTPDGKGPFSVIVYVHGAPGGVGDTGLHFIARQSRWAQFVKAGYAVCLADYRGHPENDPFAVLRGDVTSADDVTSVISLLAKQPSLDMKRLILFGQSLGGATALLGASEGKLQPAGLVLSAPASFRFIGIRGRPDRSTRELTDTEYDRAGTVARVAKINCPVLIIQGTDDGLVALNKPLAAAFKEAGKDVRLELFEGQGHGFTNGPENEHYQRAIDLTLAFARAHARS